MARQELHSSNVKVEQKPDLVGNQILERSEIVDATEDELWNRSMLDALAFNEEPVTIRLEFGMQENPAKYLPVWCNGRPAELFINDRWVEYKHGIPIGENITVRRKIVAVIATTKIDHVSTDVIERRGDNPINTERRRTSVAQSFSVIHDPNPAGHAWLTNLLRRNF